MLSANAEEVLSFIRDFETCSREYLIAKGLTEHELANAYLDLQWKFLHTILKQHTDKEATEKFSRLSVQEKQVI